MSVRTRDDASTNQGAAGIGDIAVFRDEGSGRRITAGCVKFPVGRNSDLEGCSSWSPRIEDACGATLPFAEPGLLKTRMRTGLRPGGPSSTTSRLAVLLSARCNGAEICVAAPEITRFGTTDPLSVLALSKTATA